MAANVYLNSIQVTSSTDWTPLADTSVVVAGTIFVTPYGAGSTDKRLLVRYRGGSQHYIPLGAGLLMTIPVDGVDLSELEIKYSNQNLRVFVFGHSRA